MEKSKWGENLQEKTVQAGVFWAIPNKDMTQSVLEFRKSYYVSQADSNGFVNYPYSHYEVWEGEVKGLGDDCYKYPRGRVLYDVNSNQHRVYADECISPSAIEEVVQLFEIKRYELCRDEHYTCRFCALRSHTNSATLQYNILRGRDKIGENLIEITYGATKILVELGRALDGGDEEFEQALLKTSYSAVVVSHYHEDHAGLIKYKLDCPIYIGAGAYRVLGAMMSFHGEELAENVKGYHHGRPFRIGGITVTPYRCDHSAFDSYMLLFEADGKSILYTGDFRFHGRLDKDRQLASLPKNVDALIHEGTNLGKNSCTMTESELEQRATGIMRATDNPVFVMQSGTNIDRLVSIYRASKRSGRVTYMDNYVSQIAIAVGGHIPRPDVFDDVIAFTPRAVYGRRRDMFLEIKNKRGLKGIATGTKRFTMLVRPTMMDYLKKLLTVADIKQATLIYSMWAGYKADEEVAQFLTEMQALGVDVIDLHTSGHAMPCDIELLKQTVNAKQTVCVHTERRVSK